ncbi:MAG: thioesterase [Clostridia bacterium]|jgi:thioesterase-3|nr:acyl-CoA thioesterase [Clostridiales bacterium]MDK2985001.1 thioesterase [Clostridia bacterium]
MESAITIEVRCTHLDVMGHVNNAKYLEYLEWGREDWYEKVGVDFNSLIRRGLGTVVVNININYRKEATQGDILTVRTKPLKRGNKSYVLYHEITNEDGEVVVDATVTNVVIDTKDKRSVQLIKEIARYFE